MMLLLRFGPCTESCSPCALSYQLELRKQMFKKALFALADLISPAVPLPQEQNETATIMVAPPVTYFVQQPPNKKNIFADEVLILILQYLDATEVLPVQLVCRNFYHCVEHAALWHPKLYQLNSSVQIIGKYSFKQFYFVCRKQKCATDEIELEKRERNLKMRRISCRTCLFYFLTII